MHSSEQTISFLRGPVALTHLVLRNAVRPGDHVVDATCGNGKDTALLAELVGKNGRVWAFDIQTEALARTRQRLTDAGLISQVVLLAVSHEELASVVPPPVTAVVFNLGWLPGGDRTIITRPISTLPALQAALRLLRDGGLLLITCYPGHDGGDHETDAVLDWAADLPPRQFHVWRTGQLNVSPNAPFCLLIQKAMSPHAT